MAALVGGGVLLVAPAVHAQRRWVDDDAVEPKLGVRAGAGFGVGVLTYSGAADKTLARAGTGLNVEGRVGLGHGLELGARVGFRFDDAGRGLRADELARGFETPTFGTGLSTVANPELRLRWRVRRWRWLELGAEDRLVIPVPSDRDFTEVLGIWASAHLAGVARADVGLEGVASWQSFAVGYVTVLALGAPIRLWVSPTQRSFAGLVVAPRYYGATPYTTGTAEVATGLVLGYRVRACDTDVGLYLVDVVDSGIDRSGAGLRVSCRIGSAYR
ncbi:MAG: hypothetical protein ABUS79_09355 [Pseudomonadota bacterium]